jgi:NADH:ubiquinone oxidoreductase subunit 3 (subunit A)
MKLIYKYKIREEGIRREKMVEYESGLESKSGEVLGKTYYNRYYVIGVLYIILDIEISILYSISP